jgi:Beta-lactamase
MGGRPDSSSLVARQYPDGTAPAIEGDTQAFIERITKLPLAHQPATEFEYGFSIDVLGAVIEKVSEQRLGDYLADRVWGRRHVPPHGGATGSSCSPVSQRPAHGEDADDQAARYTDEI